MDRFNSSYVNKYTLSVLRICFALVFVGFGILKPFGVSPAIPLVKETTSFLPFFNPNQWVNIVGWWEVIIGVSFIIPKWTRFTIVLLVGQMIGTFLPFFLLSEITFQENTCFPTMEGQYILKNFVFLGAAAVVGSSASGKKTF